MKASVNETKQTKKWGCGYTRACRLELHYNGSLFVLYADVGSWLRYGYVHHICGFSSAASGWTGMSRGRACQQLKNETVGSQTFPFYRV